jgi:hypothetical protein
MALEQSILDSTKKVLSLDPADDSFDQDIITHINTALSHLQQLGIGPVAGFVIEDNTATWDDFLPVPDPAVDTYLPVLSAVKTNVYLRVRLVFDPPTVSYVLTAMQQQLQESDSRLSMLREATAWVDPNPPDPVSVDPFLVDPSSWG